MTSKTVTRVALAAAMSETIGRRRVNHAARYAIIVQKAQPVKAQRYWRVAAVKEPKTLEGDNSNLWQPRQQRDRVKVVLSELKHVDGQSISPRPPAPKPPTYQGEAVREQWKLYMTKQEA